MRIPLAAIIHSIQCSSGVKAAPSPTCYGGFVRIGIILDPDFQRDIIWTDLKQSKLVESVLMRIPLPVLYLAEDSEGRIIVVHGWLRLSTLNRFMNGDLWLRLREQSGLDGKRFADLSPKLQNRIEDCNLTLYIIDSKVPERALLDIFERVNSGVPLTRQQMRSSLYSGPGTRFLKEDAGTPQCLTATGANVVAHLQCGTESSSTDSALFNIYAA